MSYIELEVIWTDDDGVIQVELTASNGAQVGKQDFYAYPKQLLEFGERLSSFPSSLKDVVFFEYGKANGSPSCVAVVFGREPKFSDGRRQTHHTANVLFEIEWITLVDDLG